MRFAARTCAKGVVMVSSANLGFPRIGVKRELKNALEGFWSGQISEQELLDVGASLRLLHWELQKGAGISHIPSGDFAYYDQVLNMTATLGAVPPRFQHEGGDVSLATYFAMARGTDTAFAMEMSKWFDTNYHYIVPEIGPDLDFKLSSLRLYEEYLEAKEAGIETRPVLIGPFTYLYLSKATEEGFDKYSCLDDVVAVYIELLELLKCKDCEWVQIDEPALVMDLTDEECAHFVSAWSKLKSGVVPKLLLATYFGEITHNLSSVMKVDFDGLHIDLVRGAGQLEVVLERITPDKVVSLGIIDGRNIWRGDLSEKLSVLEVAAHHVLPDNIQVAPSCSLLHTPIDLDYETKIDGEVKSWMAFARQKLDEVVVLRNGLQDGRSSVNGALSESDRVVLSRKTSSLTQNADVAERMKTISEELLKRKSGFEIRRKKQSAKLGLPLLPTTTIGSFPQTKEVRKQRAAFKRKEISEAEYNAFLKQETKKCIQMQEETGIDVLVHGEFERNDMVEYFGEQLDGFVFTKLGWVQSYGSRCVKPPIIYGDVSRPKPMTVEWSAYAKSLTDKPVKGMLTGPVTILQWSFVRDDQPRADTCYQIGFAIRDEVLDLEAAGIDIIQIDEAALREGLPLREKDWDGYLKDAVDAFRLCSAGVRDETQIHTHMCYSEFNDIISAIADMDADVISIETSRSNMELLSAFTDFKYPNEIGPGVYDIHSPRVPRIEEMVALLEKALDVLDAEQLWVNPDCGLKTRGWPEVSRALAGMIEATEVVRQRVG